MHASTVMAAASVLWVSAISPGPINFLVLRSAARGGVMASLPTMGAILVGGFSLIAVVLSGAPIFAFAPFASAVKIVGSLYLAWLGCKTFSRQTPMPGARATDAEVQGVVATAFLQMINPKSWLMILTLVASFSPLSRYGIVVLVALYIMVSVPCLLAWAALGQTLLLRMAEPSFQRNFDRLAGCVLLVCAGGLLAS